MAWRAALWRAVLLEALISASPSRSYSVMTCPLAARAASRTRGEGGEVEAEAALEDDEEARPKPESSLRISGWLAGLLVRSRISGYAVRGDADEMEMADCMLITNRRTAPTRSCFHGITQSLDTRKNKCTAFTDLRRRLYQPSPLAGHTQGDRKLLLDRVDGRIRLALF